MPDQHLTQLACQQRLTTNVIRLSHAKEQVTIARENQSRRAAATHGNDEPAEELVRAADVCKWEREVEICEAEVDDMKELLRRFGEVECCGREGCGGSC
jgi:hypothetical protein